MHKIEALLRRYTTLTSKERRKRWTLLNVPFSFSFISNIQVAMDLHKEKNVLLDKRKIDLEILEYLLVFQKEQKGVLFF